MLFYIPIAILIQLESDHFSLIKIKSVRTAQKYVAFANLRKSNLMS